MSQKSSVPQAVSFVSQVLKRDKALALGSSSRPLIPGMLMSERIKMSGRLVY